jgi:hypothetical protein
MRDDASRSPRTRALTPWVGALLLASTVSASPAEPGSPFYHVRSADRRVVELMRKGYARSATFRRLVDAIERTNVMVYVQPSSWLPVPMRACLRFAGVAGRFRYLRVLFTSNKGVEEATALIGHELQHVLEVGGATEILDTAAFEDFYRRKGHESVNGFDTEVANTIGRSIEDELRHPGSRQTGAPGSEYGPAPREP